MQDESNFPLDLVVSRPDYSPGIDKISPARTTRQAKLRLAENIVIVIDDSDDDFKAANSREKACTVATPTHAQPDPTPSMLSHDLVMTCMGPGKVLSSRIDRYSSHSNQPIITFRVQLEFGLLYSCRVEPLECSIRGQVIVLQRDKVNIHISVMMRLWPGVYLNDSLIQFYLNHLQRQRSHCYFFGTYFYTKLCELPTKSMAAMIRHTLAGWNKSVGDFLDKDIWLVPIHLHLHWSAVAIVHPRSLVDSTVNGTMMFHLDSGKRFRLHQTKSICDRINRYLCSMAHTMNPTPATISKPPVPAQANESDCGVHMLELLERVAQESSHTLLTKAPFSKT